MQQSPVHPTLQEHTALPSFSAQSAPFLQGLGLQGPGAVSQRSPMYPSGQVHFRVEPTIEQVPDENVAMNL